MSFLKIFLSLESNPFNALLTCISWEDQPKNRKIATIMDCTPEGHIPIVRTTSRYTSPAQSFAPFHQLLVRHIQASSNIPDLKLNHATCEIYDRQYRTMKWHTDQGLDLAADSWICLFSCYEAGEKEAHPRTLKIKSKKTGEEKVMVLSHNSCVVFSTAANQAHVHKIEAPVSGERASGRWMGVTFRLSETYVEFGGAGDGGPRFIESGRDLRMADEEEVKAFYRAKGKENSRMDYEYEDIDYTISSSDLMPLRLSSLA